MIPMHCLWARWNYRTGGQAEQGEGGCLENWTIFMDVTCVLPLTASFKKALFQYFFMLDFNR